MSPAKERFALQAQELNIFEDIFLYTELDFDMDFAESFKKKLKTGSRGYGYWVWKPYIILKSLEKIPDGAFLLYADIGCHFNKNDMETLNEYIKLAEEKNMLVFDLPMHIGKTWTKADLFAYFNVLDKKKFTDTGHIIATYFIMKKSEFVLRLIRDWLAVYYADFKLVDDSPSTIPNAKEFKEHRHDQSIFSILCKLHEVECRPDRYGDSSFFFQAKRDKATRIFKVERFFIDIKEKTTIQIAGKKINLLSLRSFANRVGIKWIDFDASRIRKAIHKKASEKKDSE